MGHRNAPIWNMARCYDERESRTWLNPCVERALPMHAKEYDSWYETTRGQWIGQREYALVCDALRVRAGRSLLDVGCGTGWFTRKFSGEQKMHVTGVDIDQERLDFGRSKDPLSLYVRGDALCLPFPDNAFDCAVSITALPFVADWPRALGELVRVSGDRFVLGLLNRNSLLWRQKGQGDGTGAYRGAHWHSAGEIASVLAALPVSNVSMRSCVFVPSGGVLARVVETLIPRWMLCGAFLVVSGQKIAAASP